MKKKNDSYSDLKTAQRLSQLLSTPSDLSLEKEPEEIEFEYVSFDENISRKEDIADMKTIPEHEPDIGKTENMDEFEIYPIPSTGEYHDKSQFWDAIVEWSSEVTGAYPVFISQSDGMLVALNGDSKNIEPEALGGRLLTMFDQAEKISESNGLTSSITIDFDKYWVTGITLKVNEELILLVLITEKQIKESVISAVKNELSQFLIREKY